LVPFVQQTLLNITLKNRIRGLRKMMKIVGQISSSDEAEEIEFITKSFVIGNRAKDLASQIKKA
jgi:hypothetical protein